MLFRRVGTEPDELKTPRTAKAFLRARLLSVRAGRSPAARAAVAAGLAAAAVGLLDDYPAATVAAFAGVGDEPDTGELLRVLAGRAAVLLPVLAADRQLDWAGYAGPDRLVPGRYGLLEPVGPRLGPAALATADLVLVPAVAVDRRGNRLGRGGGYYDRALVGVRRPVLAVVHDEEVLDRVPVEPHDRPVDGALCPAGVRWLAAGR